MIAQVCTHVQFFHFRRPLNCRPVDLSTCLPSTCRPVNLSTCQPVDLSSCRPVTCKMAIYRVCILLRGSRGLAPQTFRCESKPTPLNLTYILPYDCQCLHACAILSLPSTSTVDLSTCQPVYLSNCQPVNLSPVTWLYMEFEFFCGGLGGLPPRYSVVNQCLLH